MERHLDENDELMVAGDPKAQAHFDELEREGIIRRIDWTPPDESGQVSPVYERVPDGERVRAIFDVLERDGLVVRTGQFRHGEPVYVAARFARPQSVC